MSKTSQENKAKKAKQKELAVEVQDKELEQKAVTKETKEVAEDKKVTEKVEEKKATSVKKVKKSRSKKYLAAKKKIDISNYYTVTEAVKLVKETSLSKFPAKVEAHLVVAETGNLGEINFPHFASTAKKVVILDDTILKEIKDGQLNFDILIATPATMPKLLPLAKTLGPKGLMPNPKNGTLTDKPQDALKKLAAAKTVIKTEKKAPVVHMVVAKLDQAAKEIEANLNELINTLQSKKIKKISICSTMGPSVKIKVS